MGSLHLGFVSYFLQ
jgi:hypothetical protein